MLFRKLPMVYKDEVSNNNVSAYFACPVYAQRVANMVSLLSNSTRLDQIS